MKVENLEINATIEQILDKLIFELRRRGSKLFSKGYKESGDYLMVQCPYHKYGQERHPSSQFRKSDGLFYCHGCKEVHGLPEVIFYCLEVNGKNWLRDNFQLTEVDQRNVSFNFGESEKTEKQYIDKSVLAQYRFTHPYMFERKLDLLTIRKFDIGYDAENNCITFPIKDPDGNILFIATRNVSTKFFHYPEYVEKPLYGHYEINREKRKGVEVSEVYVCESMLDALVIWRYGKFAIALNGTGSSEQYELLRKSDFRVLILATDNDDAGRRARERLKKNVRNKLIREIDYSSYGDCKDINDMTEEQFLNAKII